MAKIYEMPSQAPNSAQFFVAVPTKPKQPFLSASANQRRITHHSSVKTEQQILAELKAMDNLQFGIVRKKDDDSLFDDD